MKILLRLSYRPNMDDLTSSERVFVEDHVDVYANEVIINQQQTINWRMLEMVEVAEAARISGISGWLVKVLAFNNEERYHVALDDGVQEAVLKNVSLNVARFIVQTIAYYAPRHIHYKGVEGLSPLEEWHE